MITIFYKKRFQKSFQKQSRKVQEKIIHVMDIFEADPYHASLRRHALKGKKYKGLESLDVTGDIRILIEEKTGAIVDVWDLGTHSQLYG